MAEWMSRRWQLAVPQTPRKTYRHENDRTSLFVLPQPVVHSRSSRILTKRTQAGAEVSKKADGQASMQTTLLE